MRKRGGVLLLACLVSAGCGGAGGQEYELTGQVLAVDPARQEITIKHEDIPRFMPGMTMAFRVRNGEGLEERVPGDLVRATLVVGDEGAHLRNIARVGFSPVAEADLPPAPIREPGEEVADAVFLNADGERRQLADLRGQAVAVTFVYTRCPVPNFCPLMDRQFKAAQDGILADPRLSGRTRLLSVTVDPAHDTPAVLAGHAASVGADDRVWEFLTPTDGGAAFSAQFGVSTFRNDPQDAEVMHNLRTAVIDPQGRLVTILNGNEWSPPELLAALREAHSGR